MKKKIFFVVTLPPPVHGSNVMSQHVVNSRLIQNGFDCQVLPLHFTDSIADMGKTSFRKLGRMLVYCFKLAGKMITFRPSLVYFTISPLGNAFYRDAMFAMIIKLFRGKLVLHLHGKGIRDNAASSGMARRFYQWVFRNTNVIILAQKLHEDISSVYKGTPFILPNGIQPVALPAIQRKEDIPVFIYLSNLMKTKGIAVFLECLKNLHQQGIMFKAKIIGASFDMHIDDARKFVEENGFSHKTEIPGPLYGEAKYQALAEANILVFPTFYPNEAFPLILLEAMQAGLAVIATDNGAITEIVEDGITGCIVPPKDIPSTTEKMKWLAQNPAPRYQMGIKAREKFERLYTLDTFEKNLLSIFKELAPDKK